jgi:hypothetical protein
MDGVEPGQKFDEGAIDWLRLSAERLLRPPRLRVDRLIAKYLVATPRSERANEPFANTRLA